MHTHSLEQQLDQMNDNKNGFVVANSVGVGIIDQAHHKLMSLNDSIDSTAIMIHDSSSNNNSNSVINILAATTASVIHNARLKGFPLSSNGV